MTNDTTPPPCPPCPLCGLTDAQRQQLTELAGKLGVSIGDALELALAALAAVADDRARRRPALPAGATRLSRRPPGKLLQDSPDSLD
jgi:hypothetical protein